MKGDDDMKLKDFVDVAVYNDYWVGVYYPKITEPVKEFKSTDKIRIKGYEDFIVTGIWVLNEDTMCVSVMKGER